ncbi:Uncharacterized protein OS=Paenibacillus sp. FSL H8-237 GN=C171_13425 PE=4 SV=1 [Gemmata massiliana]|uniref:Uncharacterized protein n=1 Tax=Gemmata massiliana TaxID=1210884 RepID=A0A6P2CZ24_9BACT|nr:hypothetical protein [Gemmata massiliana]VTR93375.1 Uncharacterized protein OS=Paenibacillus sp. FSL H8-237 GN=C171_13425 PE=4 SV=1 [Gemmata massiliana]
MTAPLTRTDYCWENGRIVARATSRTYSKGKWPREAHSDSIAVSIEDWDKGLVIKRGREWRPFREVYSVVTHTRHSASPTTPDISSGVPAKVVSRAAKRVERAISKITRDYRDLGAEERMTGPVMTGIKDIGTISMGGWEITVVAQTFSSEVKEPVTGTDFAVIADIRHDGNQVTKAAWVQAKLSEELGVDDTALEDLPKQFRDMNSHTREAYAVVYTPRGTEVFRSDAPDDRIPMAEFIGDIIRCKKGDRSPRVIANSVHRTHVIDLIMMGPGSDRTIRPRRRVRT